MSKRPPKNGGDVTVKRYGKKHMAEIAKRTSPVLVERYGSGYFAELGRRSAAKRARIMAAGRAALNEK